MKLKVLGSSSEGNCYLLEAESETLMIECGVNLMEVKKALHFNLSNLKGCIVTHCHGDHSKYLHHVIKCGVNVYALQDTFSHHKVSNKAFSRAVEPMKKYRIGGFLIMPLAVEHDVPCVAYIIEHSEMGRMLFVTDTIDFEWEVSGLNHILIECNYSRDKLQANIDNGLIDVSVAKRVERSHMELETTKAVLRGTNLSEVAEIVLIHLSSGNGDGERFKKEVEQLTGKQTFIAQQGLEVELERM